MFVGVTLMVPASGPLVLMYSGDKNAPIEISATPFKSFNGIVWFRFTPLTPAPGSGTQVIDVTSAILNVTIGAASVPTPGIAPESTAVLACSIQSVALSVVN